MALIMVSKTNCKQLFLAVSLMMTLPVQAELLSAQLVKAALERTAHVVRYDGSYRSISYPNGDVPDNIGVCTDVVIRSYRKLGIDLQKLVHEDMRSSFDDYPSRRIWGLDRTDSNIDHRRVPNLQAFFSRHGENLEVSSSAENYLPGDLVTWMLPGNRALSLPSGQLESRPIHSGADECWRPDAIIPDSNNCRIAN